MSFWAPLRHSLFKACLKDNAQWTGTQTGRNKWNGKVMVPLSEVKGQMEDKSVSHLNMLLSSWLKKQTVKGKFDALKLEPLHSHGCTFRVLDWELLCEERNCGFLMFVWWKVYSSSQCSRNLICFFFSQLPFFFPHVHAPVTPANQIKLSIH